MPLGMGFNRRAGVRAGDIISNVFRSVAIAEAIVETTTPTKQEAILRNIATPEALAETNAITASQAASTLISVGATTTAINKMLALNSNLTATIARDEHFESVTANTSTPNLTIARNPNGVTVIKDTAVGAGWDSDSIARIRLTESPNASIISAAAAAIFEPVGNGRPLNTATYWYGRTRIKTPSSYNFGGGGLKFNFGLTNRDIAANISSATVIPNSAGNANVLIENVAINDPSIQIRTTNSASSTTETVVTTLDFALATTYVLEFIIDTVSSQVYIYINGTEFSTVGTAFPQVDQNMRLCLIVDPQSTIAAQTIDCWVDRMSLLSFVPTPVSSVPYSSIPTVFPTDIFTSNNWIDASVSVTVDSEVSAAANTAALLDHLDTAFERMLVSLDDGQSIAFNHNVIVPAGTIYVTDELYIRSARQTVTNVNTTTDTITIATSDIPTGREVRITSTNSLPGGLPTSDTVNVRNIGSGVYACYNSRNDAVNDVNRINITSSGSGTITLNIEVQYVNVFGRGKDVTIIKLVDNATGYSDTANPKPLLNLTSRANANDGYYCMVHNLTLDVGSGNEGAVALVRHNNNIGTIENVKFKSSDGSGYAGFWTGTNVLASAAVKLSGLTYFRNCEFEGFDASALITGYEFKQGMAFIDCTFSDYNVAAIDNFQKPVTIHTCVFNNTQATSQQDLINRNRAGHFCVVNTTFNTTGKNTSIRQYSADGGVGVCYVRNVTWGTGYTGGQIRENNTYFNPGVAEYSSYGSINFNALHASTPNSSLNLEWEPTPMVPFPENPEDWTFLSVDDSVDDTTGTAVAAIQAAIDAGDEYIWINSTCVAFWADKLIVRDSCRRIFWGMSNIRLRSTSAQIEIQDGSGEAFAMTGTNGIANQVGGGDAGIPFIYVNTGRDFIMEHMMLSYDNRNPGSNVGKKSFGTAGNAGRIFLNGVSSHRGEGDFTYGDWDFLGTGSYGQTRVFGICVNPEVKFPQATFRESVQAIIICPKVGEAHKGSFYHVYAGCKVEILGGTINAISSSNPPEYAIVVDEDGALFLFSADTATNAGTNVTKWWQETDNGVTLFHNEPGDRTLTTTYRKRDGLHTGNAAADNAFHLQGVTKHR